MTVAEFVESEYLVHVESSLAKSTIDGYRKLWASYQKYLGTLSLDLRTCDCQAVLRQLCAANPHLTKVSLRHIKNFFSGVWSHALRMGAVDRENPWRNVAIPAAPDGGETHAYSPEEIEVILKATPAPYDLVVLLASCTGLRKSEIRGLEWRDWNTETRTLSVNRAVWRSHTKTTKSAASKAPVPVVPLLAARLDQARGKAGERRLIFASSENTPLDLDNVARRIIVPALEEAETPVWAGWHAFRRGLATFLHAKGIDDVTIQAILRHENVAITRACYIKTVPESVRLAMAAVQFGSNQG